ncbi:PAC2 family protein [Cumulibacter soli]|uniref:PAC2 family protein n=1 Tax=Cumulibacter soli TaxID=2546344 RepID=UPI001067C09E|nr:PAC2 family protein [Cumulibacter soli]
MMASDDYLPDLVDPTMICAFSGWNDAGEAATTTVEHLALTWDARAYTSIDPEDYYDFQVNRPHVALVNGVSRHIVWGTVRVSIARMPVSGRDVVLLSGPEPNLRWKTFCEEFLEIARDLGVERIVLLGGMSTDTHYERPVPVTGSAWDPRSAAQYRLAQSSYEGPTGITGVLHDAAVRVGIPTVSFWAGTPYYVTAPTWTPATVALLRRLEDVLEEPISVESLEQQAAAAISVVRTLVDQDPSIREQLDALAVEEDHVDEDAAEQLAADFERYLRRRDSPGDDGI